MSMTICPGGVIARPKLNSFAWNGVDKYRIMSEASSFMMGDVLIARCLEHVRHSGFGSIWLTAWENNGRAIRFYERWGFQKVGVYDFVVEGISKKILFS
jgi:GNAT superfamily N-acetyltransferase